MVSFSRKGTNHGRKNELRRAQVESHSKKSDSKAINDKAIWRMAAVPLRNHSTWLKRTNSRSENGARVVQTRAKLHQLALIVSTVQKAGISRREMLDVLELYNSRNEEAHKPPPAMERFVVKKDEVWVIDW